MTPTQQPPVQPQQPPQQPRPTSGKENNKAFFFALGGVALVLAIVLMFNFVGPPGPGQQVDLMNQKAGSSSEPGAVPAQAPSENGTVAPTRGDTPTAPGLEAIGAPAGGTAPSVMDPPSPGMASQPAAPASAAQ